MKNVPKSLRIWFVVHFIVDIIFGLPLLFTPVWLLGIFGIPIAATLTARMVGAGLISIGIMSFAARNDNASVYHALLNMKIVWSLTAMLAILLYIYEGGVSIAWLLFAIFLIFNMAWSYYKVKLSKN